MSLYSMAFGLDSAHMLNVFVFEAELLILKSFLHSEW